MFVVSQQTLQPACRRHSMMWLNVKKTQPGSHLLMTMTMFALNWMWKVMANFDEITIVVMLIGLYSD